MAAQPGGMQNLNAEWADPTTPSPTLDPPQPSPSTIPAYHITAKSASDVQAAVAFAHKYKIRLVIKSSGHEQTARSNAGGALLLWMRFFASAIPSIEAQFQACSAQTAGPAMTVSAGTPSDIVLSTALEASYHVVAGDCQSVCGAGGFILAGGHSVSSPSYGLGVDNVLQFTVVLADGTMATVSACSNPDLWWALRGSGGPIAVLLSVTYKLFPTQTVTAWDLAFAPSDPSDLGFIPTMLDMVLQFHLAAVNSSVPGGGFWNLGNSYSHSLVFPAEKSDMENLAAYKFLRDWLMTNPMITITGDTLSEYPSFIGWKVATRPPGTYRGGNFVWPTSRLMTVDEHANPRLRAAAVEHMFNAAKSMLTAGVGTCGSLMGNLLGGPAMWDWSTDSASVNPAFRKAVSHVMTCTMSDDKRGLDISALSEYAAKASEIGDSLRRAFPNSGAYVGESEYTEPSWEQSFWGENYARLQQVKGKYDPCNIFDCFHCVKPPVGSCPRDVIPEPVPTGLPPDSAPPSELPSTLPPFRLMQTPAPSVDCQTAIPSELVLGYIASELDGQQTYDVTIAEINQGESLL
jgi:hypothetical protein